MADERDDAEFSDFEAGGGNSIFDGYIFFNFSFKGVSVKIVDLIYS